MEKFLKCLDIEAVKLLDFDRFKQVCKIPLQVHRIDALTAYNYLHECDRVISPDTAKSKPKRVNTKSRKG